MNNALSALQFNVPEILALIGLVQCTYILVYMAFRAGGVRHAVIPFLYFLTLAGAFFAGFAQRYVGGAIPRFDTVVWALWSYGPPLSVLLMIQIARITDPPALKEFWVLALVPLAYVFSILMTQFVDGSGHADWMMLGGLLAGVISMAAMWRQRPLLTRLQAQSGRRDRYWLIMALVLANLFFLGTMLLSLTSVLMPQDVMVMRTIWGLGFVYLAGTSLFRIYPQAVRLIERDRPIGTARGVEDQVIAQKIEKLLLMDKVYQEPAYNRTSLAKELGISESVVSRVINGHFHKTIPQLLNDYRLADARRLLIETEMPAKMIADDVGFNSIASFNRVFKEVEGVTPGQFRDKRKA